MYVEFADLATRLIAAAAAGGVLGIERDLDRKPIGVRTLAMVSLGGAMLTVAATEVAGLYENKDALSRVVQGLVQGIMAGVGFIGAGVILRNPQAGTVSGMTTAASVWIAATLGIACGLGQWNVVLIGGAIALVVLVGFKWLAKLMSWDLD